MDAMEVRIERLAPMRVASVRVESEQPETEAWEKLKAWAEPRGLLRDLGQHPVFGFNNPAPSPGCSTYGYEFWMRVGPEAEPEGPVEVKEVEGGRYAVATHRGYPNPEVWKRLWDRVQECGYRWRRTHELERLVEPTASEGDMVVELYLPIED